MTASFSKCQAPNRSDELNALAKQLCAIANDMPSLHIVWDTLRAEIQVNEKINVCVVAHEDDGIFAVFDLNHLVADELYRIRANCRGLLDRYEQETLDEMRNLRARLQESVHMVDEAMANLDHVERPTVPELSEKQKENYCAYFGYHGDDNDS